MTIDSEWNPDMVVGIDFGMTCTGVAYSMAPEWPEPKQIQHWPGRIISELVNKVPTILGYVEGTNALQTWGCLCDFEEQDDLDHKQLFKLNLDPEHRDPGVVNAPSVEDAREWFCDFLRCVHDHVKQYFDNRFPSWMDQKVEWVFSVPTSWTNASMVAQIELCIKSAGFGKDHPRHRVHIGLTEAEAAAVYAAKKYYKKGDVLLVCDAGGGTTDVNVLRVESGRTDPTRLTQLSWVEGKAIGSALIDFKVHTYIVDRLYTIQNHLAKPPEDVADRMLKGRFERWKCSFGSKASEFPTCELRVPGLAPGATFPEVAIYDGSMVITRQELSRFFEQQVLAIFDLIDGQIQRTLSAYPNERISYLVLSGGLGSSPYLQKRLRERYESGSPIVDNSSQRIRILLSEEPQLAVVQGLVADRKDAVSGNLIFDQVCCRVSYGMVCMEKYDPARHLLEDVMYDKRDKTKWALNQIDWFVDQGVSVPRSGVGKAYMLKLGTGDKRSWKTSIVMSTKSKSERPDSMKWARDTGAVKPVCDVDANLDGVNVKIKNRHWYNFAPKYVRAAFSVKTVIGPADLKFQVWDKAGNMLSKTHDSIDVRWQKGEDTEHSQSVDRSPTTAESLGVMYRAETAR